jgi:glutathione S-transferase
MMLILYIANKNYSSWSLRPWVLMRALEIPFEERVMPFKPGSNWDEFRRFSPSGKVPALIAPHGTLWDSLAICEYLAEQFKFVWPEDPATRAWARCAAAEMHSSFVALREICSMSCGVRIKLREISAALQKDLARIDELWSEGLDRFGGPFLAGDRFSVVDAFFAPVVFRLQTYQLTLSPKAMAYAQHMLAFPAMQQWYSEALQETWRDTPHDEDCLSYGEVVADLRADPA